MTGAFDRLFGDATPACVFSPPERIGGKIVITAAARERAGGFGFRLSGSGAAAAVTPTAVRADVDPAAVEAETHRADLSS